MRDSSLARLKMKQYLASALLCAVLGAALLLTGRLWSGAAVAVLSPFFAFLRRPACRCLFSCRSWPVPSCALEAWT